MNPVASDLRILDVSLDKMTFTVHVDVYGGPENACGPVALDYDTFQEASNNYLTLQQWCDNNEAIDMYECRGEIELICRSRPLKGYGIKDWGLGPRFPRDWPEE